MFVTGLPYYGGQLLRVRVTGLSPTSIPTTGSSDNS